MTFEELELVDFHVTDLKSHVSTSSAQGAYRTGGSGTPAQGNRSSSAKRVSRPFPFRAAAGTTGIPSSRERSAVSTSSPFFFASSIRLTQTTTLRVTSRV